MEHTKYLTEKTLDQACQLYSIDPDKAQLIRANKNLIFDCGDKILRLSPAEIRTEEDVKPELDFVNFVSSKNLPVVNIVYSDNENLFEKVNTGDKSFVVVCFEKINGEKVKLSQWNEAHFTKLGNITGLLHKVGQQYEQKKEYTYKHWNEIYEYGFYPYLPKDKRDLPDLHETLITQFANYDKTNKNYGLIHYDIHVGNYLMLNNSSDFVLFDFELLCKSWFIFDVATVFYYANHYPKNLEVEDFESLFMNAFWSGYEKEFQISETEKQKFPYYLLYRDLILCGYFNKVKNERALDESEAQYLMKVDKSIAQRRVVLF